MFAPELVDRILDNVPVGRLAQIDDRGHAQGLPFVFGRVGNALWSPVDGKPKKRASLERLDWIAAHPEVCVVVDHYCEDWSQLWWLKLYCHGEVVRGTHAEWEQAVGVLETKYPQYATVPLFSGEPTMIRLERLEWKSWSVGGPGVVEAWLNREYAAPGR